MKYKKIPIIKEQEMCKLIAERLMNYVYYDTNEDGLYRFTECHILETNDDDSLIPEILFQFDPFKSELSFNDLTSVLSDMNINITAVYNYGWTVKLFNTNNHELLVTVENESIRYATVYAIAEAMNDIYETGKALEEEAISSNIGIRNI